MTRPIVNIADARLFPFAPEGGSDRFGCTISPMGQMIGARQMGVMLTVVEPGKRAFPFHNHHANEEMFYILEGAGEIRIGDATHPIKAGDVVACPAGGPETAHQIINTGSGTLKYLSLSTKIDPEVVEYPESGKVLALAIGEGNDFMSARVRHLAKAGESLDYWDGET